MALARALVNHPEVLLLDEPLGALDLKLRREMQVELKRIQTEVGLTFIHVTHDQEEAMTMADTVAVMNRGHIEQLGAPEELYDLPRTRFVANFLGQANTGVGTIKDVDGDHLVVNVLGTPVKILKSRSQVHEGEVLFGVRPEKVTVSRTQPEGAGNDVRGVVRDVSFLGRGHQLPGRHAERRDLELLRAEPRRRAARPATRRRGLADLEPRARVRCARGGLVNSPSRPAHDAGTRMSALAQVAGDPELEPAPAAPEAKQRSWTAYLLMLPGVLWLGVFFLLPLVQLASVSLQSRYPGFPGYYYRDLNFSNYASALTDYAPHFARSFLYAGLATFLAFAVAYPLAYAMAFKAGRWRNLMMICVIAPFFTSFILRTFAWSQILADEGWVASVLNFLHLLPNGHIINTPIAVVAGLTYNFLPFMVLPIYASLERADPRVIEAGGDLYANGFTTFRTVTLPISMPGVLAGTLLTFIPAAGDFVNMELLGPQRGKMIGNVINDQFLAVPGGYPVAAALSFTLMAAILVLVFLYVRRFGTEELV